MQRDRNDQGESIGQLVALVGEYVDLDALERRRTRRKDHAARAEARLLARLDVAKDGQMAQVDLADVLQMSVSQVQRTTELLAERGEVIRLKEEARNGGSLIRITAKGRGRLTDHRLRQSDLYAVFASFLSQEERNALKPMLSKIVGELRKRLQG